MATGDYLRRKSAVMVGALESLLPTYDCTDGKNPIRSCGDLPQEAEVIRALSLLDDVFYPGYRSPCDPGQSVEEMVIERLDEAYDILYRQVRRALPLLGRDKYGEPDAASAPPAESEIRERAEEVVGELFVCIPDIRERLKKDVAAAYRGDPAARSHSEVILSYPGIRAITTHRVAHELYRMRVPMIPRLMSEYTHRLTGIEIHPGARIGESFFIDHGGGVVIGETTLIGARVRIYQSVTLGARSVKTDEAGLPHRLGKRHPTIEDDVVLYPGATILGGDTVVGRGAIIGGNVWLTRSVPPGVTVTQQNVEEICGA